MLSCWKLCLKLITNFTRQRVQLNGKCQIKCKQRETILTSVGKCKTMSSSSLLPHDVLQVEIKQNPKSDNYNHIWIIRRINFKNSSSHRTLLVLLLTKLSLSSLNTLSWGMDLPPRAYFIIGNSWWSSLEAEQLK